MERVLQRGAALVGVVLTAAHTRAEKVCPYCPSRQWHVDCGAYHDKSTKWCKLVSDDYTEICCASSEDQCCEINTGQVVGTTLGIAFYAF